MMPYTVPGMSEADARTLCDLLQLRLTACNDLHLTLKHIHWNVVGPNFIAVHEMLDPQVEAVRAYADDIAERIATLGGTPIGTMSAHVSERGWDDYSLGRDTVQAHLAALDKVYVGMIGDHRKAVATAGEIDPITEDLLISQSAEMEKFHWFVRAHLETSGGSLVSEGTHTESGAADATR